MPGFDRTGPAGAGARTGGNRGLCAQRGSFNDRLFRGTGYGQCRGFGRRWRPDYDDIYPYDSASEENSFHDEILSIREDLEQIKNSLNEIGKNVV